LSGAELRRIREEIESFGIGVISDEMRALIESE
jgi:hypothetical protein